MNKIKSIMLDTGFLINLYTNKYELQPTCEEYFRYFLDNKIAIYVSTLSIAEYCVVAPISDIQLNKMRIVPFNIQHSPNAALFHKICKVDQVIHLDGISRNTIINDTKLLAQASFQGIEGFITKDKNIEKVIKRLAADSETKLQLKYFDLSYPISHYIPIQTSIEYNPNK